MWELLLAAILMIRHANRHAKTTPALLKIYLITRHSCISQYSPFHGVIPTKNADSWTFVFELLFKYLSSIKTISYMFVLVVPLWWY